MDQFSRYAWILTSKTQTVTHFIRLIEPLAKNHRIKILLLDQYFALNSKEFCNYLEEKGITPIYIDIDCPESQGLNERANQTLVNEYSASRIALRLVHGQ